MKACPAEMRSHRRAKFQRRPQKRLLQGFSVRRIVSRAPGRIVEEQRLVFLPGIIVFRRKYLSVPGGLSVRIPLLLHYDSKRVALARVGVKIQVIAENL